jgi:hypothetical protein
MRQLVSKLLCSVNESPIRFVPKLVGGNQPTKVANGTFEQGNVIGGLTAAEINLGGEIDCLSKEILNYCEAF